MVKLAFRQQLGHIRVAVKEMVGVDGVTVQQITRRMIIGITP
jgi:hypothetical protein